MGWLKSGSPTSRDIQAQIKLQFGRECYKIHLHGERKYRFEYNLRTTMKHNYHIRPKLVYFPWCKIHLLGSICISWYSKLYYIKLLTDGEGDGCLLPHSCLGNPMDRGAWWATVHGSQSWTQLINLGSSQLLLLVRAVKMKALNSAGARSSKELTTISLFREEKQLTRWQIFSTNIVIVNDSHSHAKPLFQNP